MWWREDSLVILEGNVPVPAPQEAFPSMLILHADQASGTDPAAEDMYKFLAVSIPLPEIPSAPTAILRRARAFLRKLTYLVIQYKTIQ